MHEYNSIFHRQFGQILSKNFNTSHIFFNYLKKTCLNIQQVFPKCFMVVLVLYKSQYILRYKAEWELQRTVSQVHKCSA